jgi:cellulose synthase/poly-beta-1,6-N-acetylglucosamine synthase-like glycosyltransferase
MMTLAAGTLTLLTLLLFIPVTIFLVQVLAALRRSTTTKSADFANSVAHVGEPTNVCVLMPAHNEAIGLAAVLQTLMPQLGEQAGMHVRLLVVADNCTDATAALAREADRNQGFIEVVERHDTDLRGKGYALHFGVQHLKANPPDVVLVADADCVMEAGAIYTLAAQCIAYNRPVQALYLMRSPQGAGITTRLAEFAWVVKNRVRPLGLYNLGLPCQLMGTGMAFSWAHISNAQLNTGHIVEDMQLGIDLARSGHPPLFCPDALVTSTFPTSRTGLQAQRTRWEHGQLGVMVRQVPRLATQAITHKNGPLFAMALDLCIPPLALLTLLLTALWASSGALLLLGHAQLPFTLASLALGVLSVAVVAAWLTFGRTVISLGQLCAVPWYVAAKVPVYLFFLVKRQVTWVRSKREGE